MQASFLDIDFATEPEEYFVVDGSRSSQVVEFLAFAIQQFSDELALHLFFIEKR
jgi:hypothetical protein